MGRNSHMVNAVRVSQHVAAHKGTVAIISGLSLFREKICSLFLWRVVVKHWKVGYMGPWCWMLAIGLATIAGVCAPLSFLALFEQGKSPAEVFTLRGKSLRCVTVWIFLTIAAIVFAGFDGATKCIEVASPLLGAFIPVCVRRVYFENYDFVEQFVAENKKRLRHLLLEGIGIDELRFESISRAVEIAIVQFWKRQLTNKRWTELSAEEIGELSFSSGLETARVVVENMGEDVHWLVFAFMREWLLHVDHVRVPERAKRELEGCSVANQAVSCIAIFLANETRQVREIRARHSTEIHRLHLPTAGIMARKTAAEGILQWPNCLAETTDIRIKEIEYNTTELSVMINGQMQRCAKQDLPECVVYTLKKMIEAGYLNISPTGEICVAIRFSNLFMAVERKAWNSSKTIERGPFRHITSVAWMAEDPAFVVEKRDIIEGTSVAGGSQVLEGILRLKVDVEVRETETTWLQNADIRVNEADIWGRIEDFVQPVSFSLLFDGPALSMLKVVRRLYAVLAVIWNKLSPS